MKKLFALQQIGPYYKNPKLCGFNGEFCVYLTNDGKMCVLGKNLIDPEDKPNLDADDLLKNQGEKILKPEARGKLSPKEWKGLQKIHDSIAMEDDHLGGCCDELGLFTLQELEEYAKTI